MKFTQLLDLNMVPEWRNQYINYKALDASLRSAIEQKDLKSQEQGIDGYFELIKTDQKFADHFSREVSAQLDKVNAFHCEKLIEMKGKYNNLQDQLEQVQSSAIYKELCPSLEPKNALNSNFRSHNDSIHSTVTSISDLFSNLRSLMSRNSRSPSPFFTPDRSKHRGSLIEGSKRASISMCSTSSSELSQSIDLGRSTPSHSISGDVLSSLPRRISNNISQSAHKISSNLMNHLGDKQFVHRLNEQVRATRSSRWSSNGSITHSRSPSPNQDRLAYLDGLSTNMSNTHQTQSKKQIIAYHKKKIRNLKFAFRELYFNLVLFEQYTQLNHTGFEQILRKHDRMFASTLGRKFYQEYIQTADFYNNLQAIDQLIEGVEHIYTLNFENGNRRRAIEKLSVPADIYKPIAPKLDFRVGFELGVFAVLFTVVLVVGFLVETQYDWLTVLRLYRSPLLLIIFLFQAGISIIIWKHYKINHVLIFELNPRNNLSSQHFIELASLLGIIWSASVLAFLLSDQLAISASVCPLVVIIICIAYLFNPTATCHHQARFWLIRIIGRIFMAPFYRVKFADFWIADQLVSIVPLFLDLEYLSCFYTTGDIFSRSNLDSESANRCVTRNPQDLVIRTIVAALPAWFRCAQCLRRWYDENWLKLHLANAGKYFCMASVVILSSVAQFNSTSFVEFDTKHVVWISVAIFTSALTAGWDLVFDFGFFSTFDEEDDKGGPKNSNNGCREPQESISIGSLSETNKNKIYPFLRKELVYPVWVYYFAIVENVILRFGWVLTISLTEYSGIEVGLVVSLLAPLEMFRRFVWNCIRLENEQLNNCGLFRAVRDIPIEVVAPIDESQLDKVIMMMDSKDGPSKRSRLMKRRALRPDSISFMVLHQPN